MPTAQPSFPQPRQSKTPTILRLIAAAAVIVPTTLAAAPIDGGLQPPPQLKSYQQPPAPSANMIWTPGYWSHEDAPVYYWVAGTWVTPPAAGLLWTPGVWAFAGDHYAFTPGYWDTVVGFYGGVNLGYGYYGTDYDGGYWRGETFVYNRAAYGAAALDAIDPQQTFIKPLHAVVNQTRIAYDGGSYGLVSRPTAAQARYADKPHIAATAAQHAAVAAARASAVMALARARQDKPESVKPPGAAPPPRSRP